MGARRAGAGGVSAAMSAPRLAVVVPAYRASATLPRLLDSLASGVERPDEVIVVDDGSPDFEPFSVPGLSVRWIRLEHRGPVAARNAGWRAAEAEWVAFVDSDCSVAPGWCAAYRAAIAAHADAAVLEGALHETYTAGFFRHWADNRRPGRYPTANIAYRRDVLAALGGLDPLFQWGRFYFREDSDLALRALAFGLAIWVEDALVHHHGHRAGPWRKLREAWRYALDPPFVRRHGLAGLRIDGVVVGPWRLVAPRQISAVGATLLWLAAVLWHPMVLAALVATAIRAAFVVGREGCAAREVPMVVVEQLLEPLVVSGALAAGAVRMLAFHRTGGVPAHGL